MKLLKHQIGVTLLEIMLVLAIAVSLVIFGIKVYLQFRFQHDEQRLVASVNQLFLALEGFHYANCRQALDANSNIQSTGALDPTVTDVSGVPQISIDQDLVTPGFTHPSLWQPYNRLLDNTPDVSPEDKGYYVQFNPVLSNGIDPVMSVYACDGSTRSPSCDHVSGAALDSSTPQSSQQSRVITWVAQVAVKLSSSLTQEEWTQIKNDLKADCISSLSSAGVAACSTNPKEEGYLVWTRMPSAYHPEITSDYWTATPYVKQFNRQYTNDPMATLSGVTKETQNWYNPFNYLCGS